MENLEKNKSSRMFDLSSVLSVTSGCRFTGIGNILELVGFVVGKEIKEHELPVMLVVAHAHILCLHPELYGVGVNENLSGFEETIAFIADTKKIYGDELEITSIPILSKDEARSFFDKESSDNSSCSSSFEESGCDKSFIIPIEKSLRFKKNK